MSIEDIKAQVMRFSLKPETLTVVKVPSTTTVEEKEELLKEFTSVIPNSKIFIVDEGFSVDRMSLEEAKRFKKEIEDHIEHMTSKVLITDSYVNPTRYEKL